MSALDDSVNYTGVDIEPAEQPGIFGNEVVDEEVKAKIQDQEHLISTITPKLQGLLDIIDAEIELVNSIKRFKTAAATPEADIRSELQAAALYEEYLQGLKTKFTLDLQESKKGKNG